jgi:hypothetical protein
MKLLRFIALLLVLAGPVFLITSLMRSTQGIYESYYCPEGTEIGTETVVQNDVRGNTTGFYITCYDKNGRGTDVSPKVLVGFCGAPIIGGVLLGLSLLGGGSSSTTVPTGTTPDLSGKSHSQPATGDKDASLSDRLKQLEDAYREGLLTQSEFEEQKQRLLDSL